METPQKHDVGEWLESLGLGRYSELFKSQKITAARLSALTDADLKALGVTALGHRKQILAEVLKLPAGAKFEPTAESRSLPPEMAVSASAEDVAPAAATSSVVLRMRTQATSLARKLWKRTTKSNILMASVIVHVLFGLLATYLIVQRNAAKRKVTFQGGPPSNNPNKRALEHKVSMAQKRKSGGAPPQAKRIATTGISKLSLPDMPSMSSASTFVPGMAAGMGGAGFGTGMGIGNGAGMGNGMGNGGGGGMMFFGLRAAAQSVVFVIDISGSMVSGKKDRTSYERLEKEAVKAIGGLSANCKLNVIAFSREANLFSPESVSATAAEKERAIQWLKGYSPCNALGGAKQGDSGLWNSERGRRHAGTESDRALERAFDLKPNVIFFVSDGEPTDAKPPAILKNIEAYQAKMPRKVVINAIAYEADGGQEFMEQLATTNGGKFKNIH